MTPITIENIKAAQDKLNRMIAAFEAQSKPLLYPLSITMPELREGEKFVAAIISPCGTRRHHLIRIPGEANPATWKQQMDWAASVGGELPDRVESALLYALMVDEFQKVPYWGREQHAADFGCAWYQNFGYGGQGNNTTNGKLRAVAVRRVDIL